ncbi:MAG: type II toxin-antitoxin system PemK/MazF family toxin [Candidatus Rokuibacteriota bacterium]
MYVVSFDPTVGAEIQKSRPAVIVQNDIANRHSPVTIVAAITSKVDDRLFPTEVLLGAGEAGLTRDSVVLLNQLRSIDRIRLVRRLGHLGRMPMAKVDRALAVSLGLIEP